MTFNVEHVFFFSKLVKVIGFRDFFWGGGGGQGSDDVIVSDRFSSENFSNPAYEVISDPRRGTL